MLNREVKYIIVKDKNNRLRHFKSDYLHHRQLAESKGFFGLDCIIEQGLFLDNELYILECYNQKHLLKKSSRYIGNRLTVYQDIRLASFLKGRELESQLYYSKKSIGLKNGD